MSRFLFAFPAPVPASGETWEVVHDDTLRDYCDLIDRLRLLQMVSVQEDDLSVTDRPFLIKLSPGARQLWERFTRDHAAELNEDSFPAHLRGPWSKMRGYTGRLILIMHWLRWAAAEFDDDKADVEPESVERAIELVHERERPVSSRR